LGKIVSGLSESGTTALGPALLTSVVIASTKPGSKVIVCTDGLANVGVGSLDTGTNSDFYEQVGQFAKRKGIVVSVISIKGAETKLENLGTISELTQGAVDLVDPDNLNFANFLKNTVIATKCVVTVVLHRSFIFRTASPEKKDENARKVTRNVGNITTETNLTYEFGLLPGEDFKGTKVPFQVQILYTKLNGAVYKRVLTSFRPVTKDRNQAEQDVDIRAVSASLAQFSAQLAQNGDYEAALANATLVKDMVARAKKTDENALLFQIFMKEYQEISAELGVAIDRERLEGLGSTLEDRKSARTDFAAKKLYNYKAAEKNACSIQ
jgi:hypothetical protein